MYTMYTWWYRYMWEVQITYIFTSLWESHLTPASCVHCSYCTRSVVSSHSNINRWTRSLGLICLVSLKRDLWDWDWKLRLDHPPNAIGISFIFYIYVYILYIYMYVSFISYVHTMSPSCHAVMSRLCAYGVATISRLLKIISLFCKRAL